MHADFGYALLFGAMTVGALCGFLLALLMLTVVHFAATPLSTAWWFGWLAAGAAFGAVAPILALFVLDFLT